MGVSSLRFGIGSPSDCRIICTVEHGYSIAPSQLLHSVHVHGSSSWLIPCSWNTASNAVNMFLMRSCASASVISIGSDILSLFSVLVYSLKVF